MIPSGSLLDFETTCRNRSPAPPGRGLKAAIELAAAVAAAVAAFHRVVRSPFEILDLIMGPSPGRASSSVTDGDSELVSGGCGGGDAPDSKAAGSGEESFGGSNFDDSDGAGVWRFRRLSLILARDVVSDRCSTEFFLDLSRLRGGILVGSRLDGGLAREAGASGAGTRSLSIELPGRVGSIGGRLRSGGCPSCCGVAMR